MVDVLTGEAAFDARFREAYQKLQMTVGSDQARRQASLASAFANNSFIYGTVGPNALHLGGGRSGNAVAKASAKWIGETKKHLQANGINTEAGVRFMNREFRLYDPGPRTGQLVAGGHQMMDMYYGMDNSLFGNRIPIIAEFVHYAMQFDKMGVPFDPRVSGRDAFKRAFKTTLEGWSNSFATRRVYGQSATREMSKIIRKGIAEFGGQLIFEGKAVYGAGIFDPAELHQGDTDLEAQDLFQNFTTQMTSTAQLGTGTLQFQWAGTPTVPTRAHFLTNWKWNGMKIHSYVNRIQVHDRTTSETGHLTRLMSPTHGLRPIWNNFANFPLSVWREIRRLRGPTTNNRAPTAVENMRDAINLLTLAMHS